jgi:DNA primase
VGRIPQHFIDDLLARTDILEVIERYVPLKKRGREYIACCPFHHEKTPSFTVSQDKQFYHCFGCGAHGTALGFLLDYEHLEFVEAIETLASDIGLEVPSATEGARQNEQHDDLYEVLEQAARVYQQALRESPRAIDYLKHRGLSGELAREYALGYAPANPQHLSQRFARSRSDDLLQAGLLKQDEQGRRYARFRNRIMFPIRNRRGRVLGFGGRVLDDGLPKYLNSPETPLFRKGESLYGWYEMRKQQAKLRRIILVEGYMDVLALAQHGIQEVVAALGTATTRQHLQQIFRATHEVVFCFDGDRAGREAAWRATQQLLPIFRDGLEARFMFLPEGQDPDTVIRREGKNAFLERSVAAQPLSEYLFQRVSEGLGGAQDAAGRARLAELAKPLLQILPEGVFKELMYKELARQTGASLDRLAPSVQTGGTEQRIRATRLTINSPVRMAVAILLHRPDVAREVGQSAWLRDLKLPGIPLLVHMLETLAISPYLTPAALLERYRGSEYYSHLLKLTGWRPPPSEDFDFTSEFRDALARLSTRAVEQRADSLLQRERAGGLNAQERQELQHLLKSKGEAFLPTGQEGD